MKTVAATLREIWGLFVEDWSFTAGILICLALAFFVLPSAVSNPAYRGPVLFLALAIVLFENVYRSAGKGRDAK